MEVELRAGPVRTVPVLRLWDRERSSGSSDEWPAPADIAECCGYHIQVSMQSSVLPVADSKNKKSSEPFPGILQLMWSCVLANDVAALLPDGGNFC